jgi:hypothetical protein
MKLPITIEFEFAFLDPPANLMVFAVEGRVAAKKDVQDDSARPDIAFLIIALRKHLGSNVVRLELLQMHLL